MENPITPQEIFDYKLAWRPGFSVIVHSDLDSRCKDWCRKHLKRHQWAFNSWVDVYAHEFCFEHKKYAEDFAEEFKDWVQ